MGYEYRLNLPLPSHAETDRLLRAIPGFEVFSAPLGLYAFRRSSTGTMPDVEVAIDASGLYLLSHGGSVEVIRAIQAAFAAIGLHAELEEL